MDSITITAIVIGLVLGLCHFVLEIRIENLIDRAFAALGLQSGNGPLVVTAEREGQKLILTLANQGRHAMRIAGIQGRNQDDKPVFPIPMLERHADRSMTEKEARREFTKLTVEPGECQVVHLDQSELTELNCRKLAVIDSNAKFWPITGYEHNSVT